MYALTGSLLFCAALMWFRCYLAAVISLVYMLWYLDEAQYSGKRAWPALRKIWARISPVSKVIRAIKLDQTHHYVYVHETHNLLRILYAFGAFDDPNLLWAAPTPLFYIPFVRDILLWLGATALDHAGAINVGHSIAVPHSSSLVIVPDITFMPTVIDVKIGATLVGTPCSEDQSIRDQLQNLSGLPAV